MRLDEWQKYIDSEFLVDGKLKKPPEEHTALSADSEQQPASEAEPPQEEDTDTLRETAAPNAEDEGAASKKAATSADDESDRSEVDVPRSLPLESSPVAGKIEAAPVPDETERAERTFSAPAIEAVIPSFDQYLPSGHPAHLKADIANENQALQQPITQDSEAVIKVIGEPANTAARQVVEYSADNKNAEEAETSSQSAGHEQAVPAQSAAGPITNRPPDLFSFLALERLYAEVSNTAAGNEGADRKRKRDLIVRLINPILTVEEAALLLGVDPAAVRRYTNRGLLASYRQGAETSESNPSGGRESRNRRFRLSDILLFLETQQPTLEADQLKQQRQAR